MASGRVEVIDSKGCSRLMIGIASSFPSVARRHFMEPMSPASSLVSDSVVRVNGPFTGLVICVTGLSKEARQQVMAATERLGGQYSSNLHPLCTHLVVQSFGGRKLDHALKHGAKNGLFVVTLGWFVDSVRRNVRLSERLYSVKGEPENGLPTGALGHVIRFSEKEKSCLPSIITDEDKLSTLSSRSPLQVPGKQSTKPLSLPLAGGCIYIDPEISSDLQKKVIDIAVRVGATLLDHWFVGCNASHVVCEGPSLEKYIGHVDNLVTPLWVLKTVKEKNLQRLVHLSVDLARQVGLIFENSQHSLSRRDPLSEGVVACGEALRANNSNEIVEDRLQIIDKAKKGVRTRRARSMQVCQLPLRPLNPNTLLDTICWSISDPPTAACVYTESSPTNDFNEQQTSIFFDARGDAKDSEISFDNYTRPLRESEKQELIFKNHFLTILFPIDRFGELGPSSRTFFSDGGFTCIQVLDHVYQFYQENMSEGEIGMAIHTDSRHADKLRSIFARKESRDQGLVAFRRVDFLGSRRSFEMLKRVSGDNNSNVYELLIRA